MTEKRPFYYALRATKNGAIRLVLRSFNEVGSLGEVWIRWEPAPHLVNRYYIESVCNNCNGFNILLAEEEVPENKVYVRFKDWVNGYRHTDETLRAHLVHELHKKYGVQFCSQWTFFRVLNSSYLAWLSEQSSTISDHMNLMHFVIFDSDTAIDIAATYEPTIERVTLAKDRE